MTRTGTALALAGLLGSSGLLHFARPGPYRAIVPRSLPATNFLVAASGAAELVAAGLLAAPRTRAIGGLAAAAIFVGVFPANVSMALRSGRRPGWYQVACWVRLPLQIPLVVGSWRVARA